MNHIQAPAFYCIVRKLFISGIAISCVVLVFFEAARTEEGPDLAFEEVRGTGCYRFGDEETPAKARRAALVLAQSEAVRSHRVFVTSSTQVRNFQLEDDVVQSASAAMLRKVIVEREERKEQQICISIVAELSASLAEDMIRQRLQAKEIAQTAAAVAVPEQNSFGLKVWTDKSDGVFLEDEKLVIYVQAERDAYLRLDYFQADGTVVHLVPNVYRGQAFIKGGRTYTFGDDSGPEAFVIAEPYGDETIKAIVSIRPFELADEPRTAVSESQTYLRTLQTGLRGIKLEAAAASVSIKTDSKSVAEYRRAFPSTAPPIPAR